MTRRLILGTVSLLGLSTAVNAEVPSVAADIPPVHSLVSIVMGDLGTPSLLVQPGASPHGYSLRPSEANALDQADAVFWIGEDLEPWLERSIASLASDAQVVELLEAEGTITLGFREGATSRPIRMTMGITITRITPSTPKTMTMTNMVTTITRTKITKAIIITAATPMPGWTRRMPRPGWA